MKRLRISLLLSAAIIIFVVIMAKDNVSKNEEVAGAAKREVLEIRKSDFQRLVENLKTMPGTKSVYIKNLKTGELYEYNTNHTYNTASLMKVFIAASVLQHIEKGNLSLEDTLPIIEDAMENGTGTLQFEELGTEYKVSELLEMAMKKSDNVAINMLLLKINREYVDDFTFEENTSTTAKFALFMENFYNGVYTDQKSVDYLIELMKGTDFDDRLHTGLPEGTAFAHKIGNWPTNNSWHDCGYVVNEENPLLVCFMSEETEYEEYLKLSESVGTFAGSLLR